MTDVGRGPGGSVPGHVRLPPRPDRAPDVADDFAAGPRADLWVPHYLPHWTTPERSAARYRTTGTGLELLIEADQPDWRPEDAPMRVSNLQTGTWSGPAGSAVGTHRHRPDGLVVRTPTPQRLLWAPSAGRVEVTVSASRDPQCMLAVWLVGTEHLSSRDAGEICVFEIDAAAVGATTTARCGIKAHGDDRLRTDMAEVVLPLDASTPHTWTVVWGQGRTLIACEGTVVRRLDQAPGYPLLLLVDLFELGPPSGQHPKAATLHSVAGWQL
jgi:hypothetical protein